MSGPSRTQMLASAGGMLLAQSLTPLAAATPDWLPVSPAEAGREVVLASVR